MAPAKSSPLDLPEDVLREVCEWAALDKTSKATCCSLALVSKDAQSIMEPLLYRNIKLSSPLICDLLERTTEDHPAKPPNFFKTAVKTIRVTFETEGDHFALSLCHIMRACAGLEEYHNVQRMNRHRAKLEDDIRELYRTQALAPPTALTISQTAFPPDSRNFTHQIFANVTHLWLHSHGVGLQWEWDTLLFLRGLTHILVNLGSETRGESRLELISQLTASSTLRLIMLGGRYSRREELVDDILQGNSDIRVVVCYALGIPPSFAPGSLEPGAWVRRNAVPKAYSSPPWILGEEKVEQRRQGSVEWPLTGPGWLENGPVVKHRKVRQAPRRLSM